MNFGRQITNTFIDENTIREELKEEGTNIFSHIYQDSPNEERKDNSQIEESKHQQPILKLH
jgi:hypothetical protein